ncbi:MAG: hypothetical protein Unbinned6046contig1000_26 [Prokaryotic dsDNA virus sp.]|nr:MAG: hypothetical protein Unbinned6046contig1000_26 [Prokaryotic dsDNA virus sp.]|tara:strand:- start:4551 stop:4961 length:411 start_codon:yes stop_codon:yes gene_type:complete
MEFNVRKLNIDDYDKHLVKWWKAWGWKPIPRDFLPEDATSGLMVTKGDQNICAGFLYLTNSKVALTEFVISNKQYKEKDRKEAIELLIDCIIELADKNGYKYAHVILKNESLLNKYLDAGYVLSDRKVTEMIKVWQ